MAVTTANLGFTPKGRYTIRKSTPSGKSPRYVELWPYSTRRRWSAIASTFAGACPCQKATLNGRRRGKGRHR